MKLRALRLCLLVLSAVATSAPLNAKVFFRVKPSAMPPSDKTEIHDLVLALPLRDSSVVEKFRSLGYHVWLQCSSAELADTVAMAEHANVAGVIITIPEKSGKSFAFSELQPNITAHGKLTLRVLVPGGKQPQMKGRLVVERDGVLQVSSPSTQPWLDTNLATVRLAQSVYPESLSIMYDFRWDTSDAPPGAWHPDAEDYALAIAESDAIRSDVVIDLPVSLQDALNAGNPEAWALWKRVMSYLDFSGHLPTAKSQPLAGLGVIFDNAQASYEPINLLARHNFAFEAVRPVNLTPARLGRWNSVVVFCSLNADAATILRDFAAKGAIVIIVNSHDKFPWHSTPPLRKESHTTTYSLGTGQIVELGEPVIDPETFARDVRRLIGRGRSTVTLWNSLTTLVTGYHEQNQSDPVLYLVNYADQPDNVQVQVKGHFSNVRLESPEEPCCASLPFVTRNGFTEFTIPSLRIAARVHLDFDGKSSAAK